MRWLWTWLLAKWRGELSVQWWRDFKRTELRLGDAESRRWDWEQWDKKW